jgi:hypothetical protein
MIQHFAALEHQVQVGLHLRNVVVRLALHLPELVHLLIGPQK